jgi:polysaccharide export outer membrane protein
VTSRRVAACWLVAALAGAGAPAVSYAQAPARAPKASAEVAVADTHPPPGYVIGQADVLEVLFWRDKELSAEVIVRPDGKITLPLLNEIEAAGLTPEQLRLNVMDRARRFVEDPRANVVVKQINSRNVFIVGEVTKPGTYPLTGPTSVLQLIATAGGLGEFAGSNSIVVLRNVAGKQERLPFNYKSVVKGKKLEQNIDLKAGDTVVVP